LASVDAECEARDRPTNAHDASLINHLYYQYVASIGITMDDLE